MRLRPVSRSATQQTVVARHHRLLAEDRLTGTTGWTAQKGARIHNRHLAPHFIRRTSSRRPPQRCWKGFRPHSRSTVPARRQAAAPHSRNCGGIHRGKPAEQFSTGQRARTRRALAQVRSNDDATRGCTVSPEAGRSVGGRLSVAAMTRHARARNPALRTIRSPRPRCLWQAPRDMAAVLMCVALRRFPAPILRQELIAANGPLPTAFKGLPKYGSAMVVSQGQPPSNIPGHLRPPDRFSPQTGSQSGCVDTITIS